MLSPLSVGRGKSWAKRLKYEYGITTKQHAEMVRSQSGLCAICGAEPGQKLDVDHNHETGKVRGLLCRTCNLGLGCFKDDIKKLKAAVKYLKSHEKDS